MNGSLSSSNSLRDAVGEMSSNWVVDKVETEGRKIELHVVSTVQSLPCVKECQMYDSSSFAYCRLSVQQSMATLL